MFLFKKKNADYVIERRKRFFNKIGSIKSILIIYYIPKIQHVKYANWSDGFVEGVKLLNSEFYISWFNLEDARPNKGYIESFDLVIFKSCWEWHVDKYFKSLGTINTLVAIVVSCSIPPKKNRLFSYDIIFFETHYYKKFIRKHPYIYHAYGIDGNLFYNRNLEKVIDVLSVGAFKNYKRLHLINRIKGKRKLIIGNTNTKEFDHIKSSLKNVEVKPYVTQEELSVIINQSKLMYIPASLQGGGERAILEAMACGTRVKIEKDNIKLKEIVEGGVLTHRDVYRSIRKSIEDFNNHKV